MSCYRNLGFVKNRLFLAIYCLNLPTATLWNGFQAINGQTFKSPGVVILQYHLVFDEVMAKIETDAE